MEQWNMIAMIAEYALLADAEGCGTKSIFGTVKGRACMFGRFSRYMSSIQSGAVGLVVMQGEQGMLFGRICEICFTWLAEFWCARS